MKWHLKNYPSLQVLFTTLTSQCLHRVLVKVTWNRTPITFPILSCTVGTVYCLYCILYSLLMTINNICQLISGFSFSWQLSFCVWMCPGPHTRTVQVFRENPVLQVGASRLFLNCRTQSVLCVVTCSQPWSLSRHSNSSLSDKPQYLSLSKLATSLQRPSLGIKSLDICKC